MMYNASRKNSDKVKKDKSKDDVPTSSRKLQDENLKRSSSNLSTPKSHGQKSSAAVIDTQKKKNTIQSVKVPKKTTGISCKNNNVPPMKGYLKSTPSSISQLSVMSTRGSRTYAAPNKIVNAMSRTVAKNAIKERSGGTLQHTNLTVNSPVAKRELDLNEEGSEVNIVRTEAANSKNDSKIGLSERQRSKTRTLKENEVKVLTSEVVDNNAEMLNLSHTLIAKPKAFYVELDDKQYKDSKMSDEEISYEDDFESYESDFDSYHSEDATSEGTSHECSGEEGSLAQDQAEAEKETRDDEKMLDSGSYDLRESQRSASKFKPVVMEFITEVSEDGDKRSSLTDEGFQEMSSAGSSMKVVHVDVLDRPIFINFSKSKESKRKRKICEVMQQRAKDILSMVTLHEMSYSLFEMKPIPYDLYMTTFGRSNYTQNAAQTYDDGVTEQTQTEYVVSDNKWTQHPVEFSKNFIQPETKEESSKYVTREEDYLSKLTYLLNRNTNVERNYGITTTEKDYRDNSLRIYLDQKNGAGSDGIMPFEKYKLKLHNSEFCINRLRKFLKKTENRISHILSLNTGNTVVSEVVKTSKFPSSVGYMSLIPTNLADDKLFYVIKRHTKITQIVFSETKSSLIMTIHKKAANTFPSEKCVICLWDISVVRSEPVKILVAIDDIVMSRFRGNTDGIFVAALEDGSIQLWDLSERAMWRDEGEQRKVTEVRDVESEALTPTATESDRQWNLRNSSVGCEQRAPATALQACAYTTSATCVRDGDVADRVVGLEFAGCGAPVTQHAGRKVVGQIVALQRIGLLTIWSTIQEKSKESCADMGKAFWSKMRLEKTQTVSLIEHLSVPKGESLNRVFNLNAAKRRLTNWRREHGVERGIIKSASIKSERPMSSRLKNRRWVSIESNVKWGRGILCNDLKIMKFDNVDNYLVAKNCGEVLCCSRVAGAVKVNSFRVTTDTSSITCLEVSPHGLPYFLAGTDSGTVQLFSVLEARVLLTLDYRNTPSFDSVDKCRADYKGRFVSSAAVRHYGQIDINVATGMSVRTVWWSRINPCCTYALSRDGCVRSWELASEVHPRRVSEEAVACAHTDNAFAELTPGGDVRIHRLANEQHKHQYLEIFHKYLASL